MSVCVSYARYRHLSGKPHTSSRRPKCSQRRGKRKCRRFPLLCGVVKLFLPVFFFSSLRCVAALFAAARYFCTSDPYLLCEVVVNLRGPRRCGVTCKNASLKREPTNGALFVKVSKVRGVPVLAGKLYDLWRGQRRIRFFSCRSGNVRSSCRR